jgi:hypothetical protein
MSPLGVRWNRLALHVVVFLAVFALGVASVQAQYSASIQGTVTDTSGALVSGATVTVTDQATGVAQTTTTSAEGFYHVSALPPGKYTVTASLEGFKEQVVKDVTVSAEVVQGVDVVLEPGEVKETVTVSASVTPALETENANLGGDITSQEIQALPQYGRDPYELIRLTPGVFGDGSREGNGNSQGLPNTTGPGGSNLSIFQVENQVPIASEGQRLSDNDYLLDGVSANSLTWGGAAVVTPNQESVQEIQVVTNGYSAEYGRNSGATVEVVSKSGTNQFHGSGFFKYDDPGLNAFNKYNGLNNPTVRIDDASRQFGGSFGGPIKKDKLFFFGSYEGLRDNDTSFADVYLLTPQFLSALQSQRSGGISTQILMSPGMQPRIQAILPPTCNIGFTSANCQVVGQGLNIGSFAGSLGTYVDNFSVSTGGGLNGVPDIEYAQVGVPATTSANQYNGRIDYTATSRDTISASTYVSHLNQTGADSSTGSTPATDVNMSPLNSVTTLLWNHIFSPTILNQARGNVTRYAFNQVLSNPNVDWGIPRVEIQGFPFGRIEIGPQWSPNTPGIFAENTLEFNDVLNQVIGNKSFKYGGEIRREQSNNNLLGGARPDIVFEGPWDFANDAPIFEEIYVDPTTGGPTTGQRYFRTSDIGLFFQNDWKLRPNFTLNLGLRWEYFSPLSETRGEISNAVFPSGGGLTGLKVEASSQLYNPDYHSFGPRFGFAYSPGMFHNKIVWRGGFGIFNDRIPEAVLDNIRQDPPFTAFAANCCGTSGSPNDNGLIQYVLGASKSPASFPANPNLAVGLDPATGGLANTGVQIYGAFPDTPTPYVYEWSLGFEYSLPGNWVAAINYEGSAGHHVDRLVNLDYLYLQPTVPLASSPGANCAVTMPGVVPSGCYQPFDGGIYVLIPDNNTSYNGLGARLTHRFNHGLYAQTYYRYSKCIDDNSYEGPGFVTNETYPQVLNQNRGPCDYDVTHYFTATAVYQLPFYRNSSSLLGRALGGWEVDPVITARSGFPWTPVSGQAEETIAGLNTLSPIRPTGYLCPPTCPLADHSNNAFIRPGGDFPLGPSAYFVVNTSAAPCQPNVFGACPGIGRNSFRGPHYLGDDVSIAKNTRLPGALHLGEAANLEIRFNFFNIFNKLNLAPFNFGDSETHIDNPTFFGLATAGLAGRVIEIQGRLRF